MPGFTMDLMLPTSSWGLIYNKIYYESQTYLDGKSKVEEGLSKGVFTKEDGSVWADLTEEMA